MDIIFGLFFIVLFIFIMIILISLSIQNFKYLNSEYNRLELYKPENSEFLETYIHENNVFYFVEVKNNEILLKTFSNEILSSPLINSNLNTYIIFFNYPDNNPVYICDSNGEEIIDENYIIHHKENNGKNKVNILVYQINRKYSNVYYRLKNNKKSGNRIIYV